MAVDSLAATHFVLDVQGLDSLRRAADQDPKAQIKAAATQFEALFLGRMLKSMRDAGYKSNLMDNQQVEFYQSLFDQQLAENMAGKGMGLADMLTRQLSGQHARPSAAGPTTPAAPRSLAGVTPVQADAVAGNANAAAGAQNSVPADSVTQVAVPAAGSAEAAGGHAGFVQRFLGAARTAARASGVPTLVILAQAALETGWGKHQAAANDGSSSHNLFGMKAGTGWGGATANGNTQEYIDGCWVPVRSSFRVYGSDLQSFMDHAQLLGSSPRYAAVREAASPEQAAQALQDCGYATDPDYADKLIAIMRQIGPLPAT